MTDQFVAGNTMDLNLTYEERCDSKKELVQKSTPPLDTFEDGSEKQVNSLKRSFSLSENEFPVFIKNGSKLSPSQSPVTSSVTSNFTPVQARRSLPSKRNSFYVQSPTKSPASYPALTDVSRRSFPFRKSPHTPLSRSYHQRCVTDQTPFSPLTSNRKYKRLRTALPYYNSFDLITLKSEAGFIDTHCHLDFLFQRQGYAGSYQEYKKKHKDTFPECYQGCLAIFCNPYTFSKNYLWEKYIEEENVWASFGCHPHNAKDYNDEIEKSLKTALEHPKVRALGEIGLDYSNRNNCLREQQHKVFKRQLKIAIVKKLPIVIHCRDAHEDGMAIMKEIVPKDYFIHLHCFTDSWELASKWLNQFPNLYIGLTNVVTFPSASDVHEVAKNIPLDRLLLETDAPYFIPKLLLRNHPGTRYSHPGMAIHVAAQVAALKGDVPLESVLQKARQNTKTVYNI